MRTITTPLTGEDDAGRHWLSRTWAARLRPELQSNLAIALVYWGVSHLVWRYFQEYGMLPAPLWPAAAVAFTAALRYGWRVAPGIYAGSVLANWYSLAAPLAVALGIGIMNSLGPVLTAWMLRHSASELPPFRRLRDVFLFLLLGVVVHAALTASGGVISLLLGGALGPSEELSKWMRWWIAHAGALVLFTPALLLWLERPAKAQPYLRLEYLTVMTIAVGGAAIVFFGIDGEQHAYIGLPLLLMVPLAWSAVRLPVRETMTLLPAVLLIAAGGTVAGYGPFHVAGNEWPLVAVGLMGLAFAITILVLAAVAEELKEREADLHRAQAIGRLGNWRMDLRCNRLTWSDETYRIFGIPKGTPLTYETFLAAVHPEDRACVARAWDAAMKGAPYDIEHRAVVGDQVRWVRERVELEFDAAGELIGGFGTTQDISERKDAEMALVRKTTELQRINAELQTFSYAVSHDLRGPLRAINGFAEALREDCGEHIDAVGRGYLERIGEAAVRMDGLINGLLSLSHVVRSDLTCAPVDLSAMAREIARDLQVAEPQRVVQWNIEPNLTATVDPVLLHAVLQNLLGNAWKFTAGREQGDITFGRELQEGREVFFVRDNGAGFEGQYAHKLFQPFERLHGAEYKGTGIGLATVRRIVQRHGGEVWAEGDLHKGATFFFSVTPGSRGRTDET